MNNPTPPHPDNNPQDSPKTPRPTRRWTGIVMYAAGLLLMAAILAKAGLDTVIEALQEANWPLLGLWFVVASGAMFVHSLRWTYLGRSVHPGVEVTTMARVYLANAFLSNLTPGRAGEVLAPVLMEHHMEIPKPLGMAIVVTDRLVDLTVLLVAALLLSTQVDFDFERLNTLHPMMLLAALGGLAALGLMAMTALYLLKRSWLGTLIAKIEGKLREFGQHMMVLRASLGVRFLPYVIASWLARFVETYIAFNIFIEIQLIHSIMCQISAMFAGIVSMLPGGLGATTLGFVVTAKLLGYPWQRVAMASVVQAVLNHVMRCFWAFVGSVYRMPDAAKGNTSEGAISG